MHLDLAAEVHQEGAIRHVHDVDVGYRPDRIDDPLPVVGVGGRDGDVADGHRLGHTHQVDGADISVGLGNRGGDPGECTRARRQFDPHREAVRR